MKRDARAFIDTLEVHLKAGHGGAGAVSFRREALVPFGGPDGGDGGRGGDIIFEVDPGETTLLGLQGRRLFTAKKGASGGPNQCTGAGGEDLVLKVPPGTTVINLTTGAAVVDLTLGKPRAVVAKGGQGGKGNRHFVSSVKQAPRYAQPGMPGEEFRARLELRVVADIGLVGLPNAGKSTLLNAATAARARVAEYPFTTLHPVLGTLRLDPHDERRVAQRLAERGEVGAIPRIILADIPGLVEGAHTGVGLGIDFLRHIERTSILLFVVDLSGTGEDAPRAACEQLLIEIGAYDPQLLRRPRLLALNKTDLVDADEARQAAANLADLAGQVFLISAQEQQGVDDLVAALVETWLAQ